MAWDDVFQATFNRDDPLASVLPGESWHEEGRALAAAIRALRFEVIASL